MDNKVKFLRGTATEYEASTKDNDTFYYTADDEKLYLGNKEITNGGVTIDDTLSDTSKNPVQNKVINAALNNKAELSDIPTTLPANGGNADTLDGKHASDFALKTDIPTTLPANGGTANTARETVSPNAKALLWEDNEGGNLKLVSPDGNHSVEMDLWNNEGFRMYFTDNGELTFPVDYNSTTKKFNINGNAEKVGGYSSNQILKHIASLPSKDCNDLTEPGWYSFNGCDGHAPGSNSTITSGTYFILLNVPMSAPGYFVQIATFVHGSATYLGKTYIRHCNNGVWTEWGNIADGGNAATVNGYTVNANVPAGFSPIGQNTKNKTYTYEGTTYTGSSTSEVFNDYTNNEAAGGYSHAEGYMAKALKPYSHAEGKSTIASNNGSHAEGSYTTASGGYSHAEGSSATASGEASHAEGSNTTASGNYSHAEGAITKASGNYSHAEGGSTTASGAISHAEGNCTTASGGASHAEGNWTTATSFASHAGGKYNKEMTSSTSETDNTGDAFVIGNGTETSTRSNAFRVTYGGAVYGLSAFNSSGADYAEFIKPWGDGNTEEEDRVGYFVTIKDGLLYKANEGDYIVGITSGNPSVVGNADEDYYWRYERDEFNRFVYEDAEEEVEQLDDNGAPVLDESGMPVMVKTGNIIKNAHYKLAADYDSKKQNDYIERKNRPEWSYVGMIGVLPVRDDGTCVAGGFAKCGVDGIATKADKRDFDTFFVIERINENVISVEMR